jgi:5-methylcytosine-specific restriction endonuclease McrA
MQPYCSWCGKTEDLTGDHITPLSKGGTNEAANVRVLCRSCNSRRGNRQ